MGILSKVVSKGLSKTGKKQSSEVAKKSTEVMGRRPNKDMGMVEEVTPKRLSGPKAEDAKEAVKRSGSGKAIAAGVAATGAAGATMLSGRNKEDKKEPTKAVVASRVSEGKVTKTEDARPISAAASESKAKEDKKPSSFGAAFKEARAAGKDVFTYNGKKYTTEMAGEKKATPKVQVAPRAIAAEDDATMRLSKGVREGRNENIDEDTRKRAMSSVANLAKGGYVNCGASVPPAQKRK